MRRMSPEFWASGSDREVSQEEKVAAAARARALFEREPKLKGVPVQYHDLYLSVYRQISDSMSTNSQDSLS